MEPRKLFFTHQNFGFKIVVSDSKPLVTKDEMIPLYDVRLTCTDANENYSVAEVVREQKLASTINKMKNKTAAEWVAAYDQKGSAPSEVDKLLTTIGFE